MNKDISAHPEEKEKNCYGLNDDLFTQIYIQAQCEISVED